MFEQATTGRQDMTSDRRRIATAATVAAVALALSLAACGGGVKNSNATTSATTGTTGTTASAGGQSTTGTATISGSDTTSTTNDAAAPAVAQETVKAPESKDGTVDIAVLDIAVQGQLATLRVRFSPHFPSQPPDDSISLYDMSGNAIDPSEVSLVDPVGLKRYLVVKDSNNQELGSDEVYTKAVNNSSVIAHYTFAAPPASVSKIDVQLGPFPPLNDVPITR
jgi:hypothetical protein